VPPFNACFEAGLAAGFDADEAVPAKIAATSIITPRAANTAESNVFLGIGLLSSRSPHGNRRRRRGGPHASAHERFSCKEE
jgi:hypothetical protein